MLQVSHQFGHLYGFADGPYNQSTFRNASTLAENIH